MTLNHSNPNNTFVTKRLSTFSQHLKQKDEKEQNYTDNRNFHNNHATPETMNTYDQFDEEEEWEKISEIMESFGSGIARESVFVNDIENEFRQRLGLPAETTEISTIDEEIPDDNQNVSSLKKWLIDVHLEHLEEHLLENGYDDPNFINGLITNENDLEICGIPEVDRQRLLNEISKLPKPLTLLESNSLNNNNNSHITTSVDNWLSSIKLEEYINVFK